jgi:hypothetical protein
MLRVGSGLGLISLKELVFAGPHIEFSDYAKKKKILRLIYLPHSLRMKELKLKY